MLHTMPPGSSDIAHGAIDQLRAVLALVEEMAGEAPQPLAALVPVPPPSCPIARRRLTVLAAETATFAAAGIEALIRHKDMTGVDSVPAARALAGDMRRAIEALERIG
jgi:hypothetical protein